MHSIPNSNSKISTMIKRIFINFSLFHFIPFDGKLNLSVDQSKRLEFFMFSIKYKTITYTQTIQ